MYMGHITYIHVFYSYFSAISFAIINVLAGVGAHAVIYKKEKAAKMKRRFGETVFDQPFTHALNHLWIVIIRWNDQISDFEPNVVVFQCFQCRQYRIKPSSGG